VLLSVLRSGSAIAPPRRKVAHGPVWYWSRNIEGCFVQGTENVPVLVTPPQIDEKATHPDERRCQAVARSPPLTVSNGSRADPTLKIGCRRQWNSKPVFQSRSRFAILT